MSYPGLLDWRRQANSLAGIAPYTDTEGTLIEEDGPVPLHIGQVGEDFFAVLGSKFAVGRAFSREEFLDGAPPLVILSGTMWQRDFGGDRAIVGRSIPPGTGRVIVVGVVAPREFTLPLGAADLWTPLLPIRSMRTLDEIVSAAIAPPQFRAAFIGSLAVLALALAVVGVYGVRSLMFEVSPVMRGRWRPWPASSRW